MRALFAFALVLTAWQHSHCAGTHDIHQSCWKDFTSITISVFDGLEPRNPLSSEVATYGRLFHRPELFLGELDAFDVDEPTAKFISDHLALMQNGQHKPKPEPESLRSHYFVAEAGREGPIRTLRVLDVNMPSRKNLTELAEIFRHQFDEISRTDPHAYPPTDEHRLLAPSAPGSDDQILVPPLSRAMVAQVEARIQLEDWEKRGLVTLALRRAFRSLRLEPSTSLLFTEAFFRSPGVMLHVANELAHIVHRKTPGLDSHPEAMFQHFKTSFALLPWYLENFYQPVSSVPRRLMSVVRSLGSGATKIAHKHVTVFEAIGLSYSLYALHSGEVQLRWFEGWERWTRYLEAVKGGFPKKGRTDLRFSLLQWAEDRASPPSLHDVIRDDRDLLEAALSHLEDFEQARVNDRIERILDRAMEASDMANVVPMIGISASPETYELMLRQAATAEPSKVNLKLWAEALAQLGEPHLIVQDSARLEGINAAYNTIRFARIFLFDILQDSEVMSETLGQLTKVIAQRTSAINEAWKQQSGYLDSAEWSYLEAASEFLRDAYFLVLVASRNGSLQETLDSAVLLAGIRSTTADLRIISPTAHQAVKLMEAFRLAHFTGHRFFTHLAETRQRYKEK